MGGATRAAGPMVHGRRWQAGGLCCGTRVERGRLVGGTRAAAPMAPHGRAVGRGGLWAWFAAWAAGRVGREWYTGGGVRFGQNVRVYGRA